MILSVLLSIDVFPIIINAK